MIPEVVHKTARGLRDAGLMETKTMREFDVLCLPRVNDVWFIALMALALP